MIQTLKFYMTHKLILPVLLCFTFCSFISAQNVGIGTTSPSEKLDVNGNLNLNGNLKINSNAGKPGQVLMKSNANNLMWGDPSGSGSLSNINGGYKHNFVITNTGSGSFTVPTGDTSVLVEIWGAGGAGSVTSYHVNYCYDPNGTGACDNLPGYSVRFGCGGGGGGYVRALLKVTAGQSLSYYVGAGKIGNGDSSKLDINGSVLIAQGGKQGDTTNQNFAPGLGLGGGFKGPVAANSSINYFTGGSGGNGMTSFTWNEDLGYSNVNVNFGNGGDGGNSVNTGGTGGYLHVGVGSGAFTTVTFTGIASTYAKQPGGGGASNPVQLTGGNGMIIFWW